MFDQELEKGKGNLHAQTTDTQLRGRSKKNRAALLAMEKLVVFWGHHKIFGA